MKNICILCCILFGISIPVLFSSDFPHVRIITGSKSADQQAAPPQLAEWMKEDLLEAGLTPLQASSNTNNTLFQTESEKTMWVIRQDANSSGGVLQYAAELYRQNWKVSEYVAYSAGTNELRIEVRNAVERFAPLVFQLAPDSNTDAHIASNTNQTIITPETPVTGQTVTGSAQTKVPSFEGTKRFGGLVSIDGSLNLSGDSNSGVSFYSGGLSIHKNLFGGLYLGWKTAYDQYSISYTDLYSYRLDLWKNTVELLYHFTFSFPVFIEAGLGFGGFTGRMDYRSEVTNFNDSVMGPVIEPKAGIGLNLGDLLFSIEAAFNYSLMVYNSTNYPLMGFVAGASAGWKF